MLSRVTGKKSSASLEKRFYTDIFFNLIWKWKHLFLWQTIYGMSPQFPILKVQQRIKYIQIPTITRKKCARSMWFSDHIVWETYCIVGKMNCALQKADSIIQKMYVTYYSVWEAYCTMLEAYYCIWYNKRIVSCENKHVQNVFSWSARSTMKMASGQRGRRLLLRIYNTCDIIQCSNSMSKLHQIYKWASNCSIKQMLNLLKGHRHSFSLNFCAIFNLYSD
jgi:hypothetical protein